MMDERHAIARRIVEGGIVQRLESDAGPRTVTDALTPSLSHRMGEGARRAGEGSACRLF